MSVPFTSHTSEEQCITERQVDTLQRGAVPEMSVNGAGVRGVPLGGVRGVPLGGGERSSQQKARVITSAAWDLRVKRSEVAKGDLNEVILYTCSYNSLFHIVVNVGTLAEI